MTLTANQALVLPKNYVSINETEMEYVDGGWSGSQVLRNVCGAIAVFSIGYAGAAFKSFVCANAGLSYGSMLIKCGKTLVNFLIAAPWQIKIVIGVCTAAALYALGQYDLF